MSELEEFGWFCLTIIGLSFGAAILCGIYNLIHARGQASRDGDVKYATNGWLKASAERDAAMARLSQIKKTLEADDE